MVQCDVAAKHVQQWLKPYLLTCKYPDVLALSAQALQVVSPIYTLPQLQDMLYTMDDSVVAGKDQGGSIHTDDYSTQQQRRRFRAS